MIAPICEHFLSVGPEAIGSMYSTSGYPCPVPDLQGNSFSFTSLRIIFAVGLSYMGASLVAQLVKNLPAMRETWIQSLGWGDPLEKRKATHSSILAWRIHGLYSPWGHKELGMTERLSLTSLLISNHFKSKWTQYSIQKTKRG